MRSLMLGAVWIVVACVVAAEEPKAEQVSTKEAVAKALESFAGTWEIANVQPDGATKEARRLVFKTDGTYAAQDKDGKELWAGTFEIDPTVMPKVWNHRSHEAKKKGKDMLGIYELDVDKLKVACVAGQWTGKEWAGKPRPMTTTSKDADVVIELTRAKSTK